MFILQDDRDDVAFVGIATGQAMFVIGAPAIQHRVPLGAGADICVNTDDAQLVESMEAVKAVSQPVIYAIKECDDRRETSARDKASAYSDTASPFISTRDCVPPSIRMALMLSFFIVVLRLICYGLVHPAQAELAGLWRQVVAVIGLGCPFASESGISGKDAWPWEIAVAEWGCDGLCHLPTRESKSAFRPCAAINERSCALIQATSFVTDSLALDWKIARSVRGSS